MNRSSLVQAAYPFILTCLIACYSNDERVAHAQTAEKPIAENKLDRPYLSKLHAAITELASKRVELPTTGPLREVRANLHVHSELSHDSIGKIENIVAAAKAAGSEVLMFTEHPSESKDFFLDGHTGMRGGVLLIPGAEMKGLLVYPTMSVKPFAEAEPKELTDIVRTRGGHVFLSHLEERMDWEIPSLTGVEIYNTHGDYKRQKQFVDSLKNPIWFLKVEGLVKDYPQEVLSSLQSYQADYLKRWDELCQRSRHTGIAANDAHENVGAVVRLGDNSDVILEDPLGKEVLKLNRLLVSPFLDVPKNAEAKSEIFRVQLDRYENSLRHVGTHMLVTELTRDAVWEALSEGRVFVAFDWLANAKGFDVCLRDKASRIEMGSELMFREGLKLEGHAPLAAQWRLIRNGSEVLRQEGSKFSKSIEEPGVYRLELWLRVLDEDRIWILTNPFYIKPAN